MTLVALAVRPLPALISQPVTAPMARRMSSRSIIVAMAHLPSASIGRSASVSYVDALLACAPLAVAASYRAPASGSEAVAQESFGRRLPS